MKLKIFSIFILCMALLVPFAGCSKNLPVPENMALQTNTAAAGYWGLDQSIIAYLSNPSTPASHLTWAKMYIAPIMDETKGLIRDYGILAQQLKATWVEGTPEPAGLAVIAAAIASNVAKATERFNNLVKNILKEPTDGASREWRMPLAFNVPLHAGRG